MVCVNCGYEQDLHIPPTLRCPSPNILGTRWATTIPKDTSDLASRYYGDSEFTTCQVCYALVRTENSAKHAAFHEGAKAWFEHLLSERESK